MSLLVGESKIKKSVTVMPEVSDLLLKENNVGINGSPSSEFKNKALKRASTVFHKKSDPNLMMVKVEKLDVPIFPMLGRRRMQTIINKDGVKEEVESKTSFGGR